MGSVSSGQLLHPMVLHNYINMVHIYTTLSREAEAATARSLAMLTLSFTVTHNQLTH